MGNQMIDWAGVAFNALWILGAAIILATLSRSSYDARRQGRRWGDRLGDPGPQTAMAVGTSLICTGMAFLETVRWQQILWGGLAGLNLIYALRASAAGNSAG